VERQESMMHEEFSKEKMNKEVDCTSDTSFRPSLAM
jgi:hypothetical protein